MKILKCPICGANINKYDKVYRCQHKHSFDIAKQGYCNLLQSQSSKEHGDSKAMLRARDDIQQKGYYQAVAKTLTRILEKLEATTVLDIGCGTGYYTRQMKETLRADLVGVDISKEALKIAASKSRDIDYFVASNKDLPFKDGSVDVVTSVFSPIYEEEVTRVLKHKGYMVVVSPNEDHLIELKSIIYDSIIKKEEDRHELRHQVFTPIVEERVIDRVSLSKEDLEKLFLMTPHYWTSSLSGKARLKEVPELTLTIDVTIKVYQYQETS